MTSYLALTNVRRRGWFYSDWLTQRLQRKTPSLLCNNLGLVIYYCSFEQFYEARLKIISSFCSNYLKRFRYHVDDLYLTEPQSHTTTIQWMGHTSTGIENSLGANLTIIKVYRNKLCHASKPRINDKTFRKMKSSLIHVRFTL